MAEKIRTATYKIFNGTDWDVFYFKTSAGQVGESTNLKFLRPNINKINGKSFTTTSGIDLYASDIKISNTNNMNIQTYAETLKEEANTYTNNQIKLLVGEGTLSEAFDTLKEVDTYLTNHKTEATNMMSSITTLEGYFENGTAKSANYAGRAGGAHLLYDTESAVGITKGASNKPVYFINGIAQECEFTVNTSVPSNAKFTDTTYTALKNPHALSLTVNNSTSDILGYDGSIAKSIKFQPNAAEDGCFDIVVNNVTHAIQLKGKFTDTTYSSLTEQKDGTNVSLVTTGEKYNWNNNVVNLTDNQIIGGQKSFTGSANFSAGLSANYIAVDSLGINRIDDIAATCNLSANNGHWYYTKSDSANISTSEIATHEDIANYKNIYIGLSQPTGTIPTNSIFIHVDQEEA